MPNTVRSLLHVVLVVILDDFQTQPVVHHIVPLESASCPNITIIYYHKVEYLSSQGNDMQIMLKLTSAYNNINYSKIRVLLVGSVQEIISDAKNKVEQLDNDTCHV